jgi:hypothetical protein
VKTEFVQPSSGSSELELFCLLGGRWVHLVALWSCHLWSPQKNTPRTIRD